MQYKIIYSKRKTISLSVSRNAEVVVRAPKRVPLSFIEELVLKRSAWLQNALAKQKDGLAEKQFADGEQFLYLGKYYPLQLQSHAENKLEFIGTAFQLCHTLPKPGQGELQHLLRDLYTTLAKQVVLDRVALYALRMNLQPGSIRVKNTVSQWGSCTRAGDLSFSVRLVLAPLEVLDYVVVHELAHLKHRNHSQGFWELVFLHCPDYKRYRKLLRLNGHKLSI